MDPLQLPALNALEQYLALASAATSPRAASDLISQATSAPNTYVFAELLAKDNIQALRSAEEQYARWLTVLEMFAWGTWAEYQCTLPFMSLSLSFPRTTPRAMRGRSMKCEA
jgi:COP9 signalosome complex subunit 7